MQPLPFKSPKDGSKVTTSLESRTLLTVRASGCNRHRQRHQRAAWGSPLQARSTRQRQVRHLRCHAGNKPPSGIQRLLKWGQKFLQSIIEESGASHNLLDTSNDSSKAPSRKQATSKLSNAASKAEASTPEQIQKVQQGLPVAETVQADTSQGDEHPDTSAKVSQSGRESGRERPLSTISLYDKTAADHSKLQTRSSVGGDPVRVNAQAKVSRPQQRANFNRLISKVSRKERAERELKRRKKAYYHLSRQHEITSTWPPADEPTWDQWQEHMAAVKDSDREFYTSVSEMQRLAKSGKFEEAERLRESTDQLWEKDSMGHIIAAYQEALRAEDYEAAAHLRDQGGLGLVGWWYACSSNMSGRNVPHLLQVSPAYNRLVFKAYTPMELAEQYDVIPAIEPIHVDMENVDWQAIHAENLRLRGQVTGSSIDSLIDEEGTDSDTAESDDEGTVGQDGGQDVETASSPEAAQDDGWGNDENPVAEMHFLRSDNSDAQTPEGSDSWSGVNMATAKFRSQVAVFQKRAIVANRAGQPFSTSAPSFKFADSIKDTRSHAESLKDTDRDIQNEGNLSLSKDLGKDGASVSGLGPRSSYQMRHRAMDAIDAQRLDDRRTSNASGPPSRQEPSNGPPEASQASSSENEAIVPNPESLDTGASKSSEFDSKEVSDRKQELLKNMQLHHNLDKSTDVPILHIFLTAKKDDLESYRETQQSQLAAEKSAESSVTAERSSEPETQAEKPALDPSLGLSILNMGDSEVAVIETETQRVPADVTLFPEDRDRFMISVFPDTLMEELQAKYANSEHAKSRVQDPAKIQKASSIGPGDVNLSSMQEQMQAVVQKFAQANGYDPEEIMVDLSQTMEEAGVLSASVPDLVEQPLSTGPEAFPLRHSPFYDRLEGTTCYKRLPRGMPKSDPLTGFFLRCTSDFEMVDVLLLERVKEKGKEFVVAKLLTFQETNENGRIVFKADVSSNKKMETLRFPFTAWEVDARYKAKVLAQDGKTWTGGVDLLKFSAPAGAHDEDTCPSLGITGNGYTSFVLYKIMLDDPWVVPPDDAEDSWHEVNGYY